MHLEEGGVKLIRVADDGSGIANDELPLALTRHATRKIAIAGGPGASRQLGFRGEALASVASVARLAISSRERGASHAWKLKAEPGAEPEPAALMAGTVVEMRDLYYNTPARRKFLKAEGTEFAHCADAVKRLALTRPDVAFSLTHNGRNLFQLAPADSARRIADILGDDFLAAARRLDAAAGPLAIAGFAIDPTRATEARDGQYCLRQWPLRARQGDRPRPARSLPRRAARQPPARRLPVREHRPGAGRRQRAPGQDRSPLPRLARHAPVRFPRHPAHAGRAGAG